MKVGDRVADSPDGPGVITSFTERGYPRVNHVAVAWLRLEDGQVFDYRARQLGSPIAGGSRHPRGGEMTIDPFADVRNQAMGDLTAEQQDRVWELWLRENTGAMPEYYIDHLQVLFRVIDRLRAEIEQLKTRLEVDPRAPAYDGIACRDETIRHQDAMLAEVDGLRTELHERRLLIDKMANILERSVNALRGPPPSMVLYTWHDLPERVAAMRAALAELVALKDLKDAGLRSPDDEDEYFRRKPQAWAAAREAITGGNNAD